MSEHVSGNVKQADKEASRAAAELAEISRPRQMIASYSDYTSAERAVDWLSDQGFAVERSAIVGSGLRSVEQVRGRMTGGEPPFSARGTER
jgi:hypothetical protein